MFTNNMKEHDQKLKQIKEDQKVIESIRKRNLEQENEKINLDLQAQNKNKNIPAISNLNDNET